MSSQFLSLLILSLLYLPFWIWYLYARRRIFKGLRFRILLFFNMVFGYFLIFLVPFYALIYYGITNIYLTLCLLLMIPGAIMHHMSVILLNEKDNPSLLELIHGPISHLAIGIPLVLTGLVGIMVFHPMASSKFEIAISLFWFIETEFFGVLLILMGFNLSKLKNKW